MNRNYTWKGYKGVLRSVVFGIIASLSTVVVSILLLTICIRNEYLDINMLPILAILVEFLAVFVGANVACLFEKEGKTMVCMLSAGICFLLLFLTGVVNFDCRGVRVLSCLIATIAGLCASLLIAKRRKVIGNSRGGRWRNR